MNLVLVKFHIKYLRLLFSIIFDILDLIKVELNYAR